MANSAEKLDATIERNKKYIRARRGKVEKVDGNEPMRKAVKRLKRAQRQKAKRKHVLEGKKKKDD